MPVVNGSFEEGTGGEATEWTRTTVGAIEEFADFSSTPHDVGFDDFEEEWTGSALKVAFEGLFEDLEAAAFTTEGGTQLFDTFCGGWVCALFATLVVGEVAQFGSDDHDGFELWATLLPAMPATEAAVFDSGLTPEPFEDFEDGFGLGTQELKGSFLPGDLSQAVFGASDSFESFENGGWSPL